MKEPALVILVVVAVLLTILATIVLIFVWTPKQALVESRVADRMHSIKVEVNKCNEDGGRAYIPDDYSRVFCERINK